MKKRILALLLLVTILIPLGASAGVGAKLNQKMATRSGPGTKFSEELGTHPKTTAIEVIAQIDVGGTIWYQVEFTYNGKLYRAYTGKKRVDAIGDIPWENTDLTDDVTVEQIKPKYGPGEKYANRRFVLAKNTKVQLITIEDDWAFIEYKEDKKKQGRGYVPVTSLQNAPNMETPAPTATPAPAPEPAARVAYNIIDKEKQLCVDYYGNVASYKGHDEEFAQLIGALPVMSYFDGVPCVQHTDVYSGPGYEYWRRYNSGSGYAYTGILDTNLHIYGQERGWILIRYPSDANKGYRFGWVVPTAISPANQNKTPEVEFAYLPVITTRYVDATDDPERSIQYGGTSVTDHIEVSALAFLNEDRNWVYCEYTMKEGLSSSPCRGFLPADALRIK